MKDFCCILFFCLLMSHVISQCDIGPLKAYDHHQIVNSSDTINYHSYARASLDSIESFLIYIQGSGPQPLFNIQRDSLGYQMFSSVPFDLELIPEKFALILVSKKSIPFCVVDEPEYQAPESYFVNEKLDYRVFQNDKVVKDLANKYPQFKKMIILGHSEGSDVSAKLCIINADVTHLAYWAGGGNSQFYDFPLFISKEINAGKISQEEGLDQYKVLINQYKLMMSEKDSIHKRWYDNSFTRWAHFSEPPIKSLIQLDIPIYLAMGMNDMAVPIESAMLIPVEFARLEKDNLTYKFYPNLDHSFNELTEEGEYISHWDEVFLELVTWLKAS